jgi:hypothetical protein
MHLRVGPIDAFDIAAFDPVDQQPSSFFHFARSIIQTLKELFIPLVARGVEILHFLKIFLLR